ncbi:N-acetylmuramoyl-L-alanine amidase [Vulcanococcus limneticus]|uniref:N-acetylmuramoyl-L-alanine amidase n=1 Tax=Vulcanococcus limneticus TaxID=2170428 RepID=UPI00398BE96B
MSVRGRSLLAAGLPLVAGLATLFSALPAWAGSALGAWRISREGQLELRTSPDIQIQAFYESGRGRSGPRIWVDLPGAPIRTRTIPGAGLVRQVRIGKPTPYETRLVLEFQPGTPINPAELRLVGTARDRWRMDLKALGAGLVPLGEGDVEAASAPTWRQGPPATAFVPRGPLNAGSLPQVPRGRFKVVIDPGHGGPDPGAVGIGGLRETDVVLDVGLQVAQLLQARGVQVLLTRTSEVDVDLPPRVALANNSGADLFLSIHANALSMARPDVNGIETFYFQSSLSRALAQAVQEQVLAISPGSPDRGVRPGRFFVIRRTVMPSALVEMGFVTGQIDAPRLADAGFRRRLAVAIATGLLNHLGGR